MMKEKGILEDELEGLRVNIKSLVEGFYSSHGTDIPKNHKLNINVTAGYSSGGGAVYIHAEVIKRQKSWNEMIVCELTKNDWKKIFKSAFFTQSNRMGNSQAARFFDILKKLETGEDCERQRSLSNDDKNLRWVVSMKETDRNQINRIFGMSGLIQYGLVNYSKSYDDCSAVMAKFW